MGFSDSRAVPHHAICHVPTPGTLRFALAMQPCSFRRMSTSACVSPVSGLTWSTVSESGTDAEVMSGGLALAGFTVI